MSKTVLITGALAPNGKAIAQLFAQKGYAVVLQDEDSEGAAKMAKELNVKAVKGTTLTDNGAKSTAEKAKTAGGNRTIDILINNAGRYPEGTFDDITADDLRAAFRSNVISAMCITKAVSAMMKEHKHGGHIVNMSRDNAFVTDPNKFIPSTTAWAMRGTTRAMAKQLAKPDIKVNACCVGDKAAPEEVANAVLFLADDGNRNMTGQNIMVNHGTYMD